MLVFSDQNFVPTLSGGNSCVAVARLENGRLEEIADLAVEVLERHPIPPGTVLILGFGYAPAKRWYHTDCNRLV